MPRPMTLKARNRKPPELGPKVRVEAARLSPPGDSAALLPIINGAGLRDTDQAGLKEHDTSARNMWCGTCETNLTLEFELPAAVPLAAIEVWNYNAKFQTTNGVRKADVCVSADGQSWQTVLRAAKFAEAEGNADYDEPVVLKLKGATARKVRFENIVPLSGSGKVGLSEVVFHQAPGPLAAPRRPEDGATGISAGKTVLEWTAGEGAKEHRVYFGTNANKLESLGPATQARLAAPRLKPDTTYFWRVDEVESDGSVVSGRVARFATGGLVAWWKLDETQGTKAQDASGHELTANVGGKANWAPDQGRFGGAMEFDGNTTLINCGRSPEFDFTDGMTVSAWIKVRKFDKGGQAIVTKGATAWRLQRDGNSGKIAFSYNFGERVENGSKNLIKVVSKRNVDDGEWHHLVGLIDGERAGLYLDGELEATAEAKPIARNTQPVMIGCNSEFYERRFNGWIADVRIYGYGLSEAEVKALYHRSAEPPRAGK